MVQHSDAARFLQTVFPSYGSEAILANLNPPHNTRSLGGLDGTRDCYWSIAAFEAGATTHHGAGALRTVALVIDDVGTKVPEAAVSLALGPPTAVVETSAGNFQWTYRLSKPVETGDWPGFFAGVQVLVGQRLDSPGAQALFRLPMGVNTKPGRGGFAVRLVALDASVSLDPDTISRVAAGGASAGHTPDPRVARVGAYLDLIPNDDVSYDEWMMRMHQAKALALDEVEAFEAFDAWSAKSGKYDAAETRRRWETVEPSRTSGLGLLHDAETADKAAFDRLQGSEARAAFDDDVVATAAGAGGGVEFFVDQERSSVEVVRHFAGRLKQVGRGDWREFVPATGRWRTWTGDHMMRRVLELVRERKTRPMDAEVAKKLGSVKFIAGIAQAAALHASMVGSVTDFDRGALVLGVPSGVVDLGPGLGRGVRTGKASEMVSKAMWVDPAPVGTPCPEWRRFLGEFTQGDAGLERWLQVRAGYCLTGLMDEPIMPFYHGSGGNGKSVYLNALRSVWGEYGTQMDHRLLFEKQGGYHLAPLAVLAGVRLAIVTDVPQAATWDVLIMKMLTGDDAITANRMHQNPITFKSTAKVDVSGNGEPVVKDMDDGVRRRLRMIPLTARPKTVDKQLGRKLYDEYPAILRWALEGLDEYWRLGGFPACGVVDDATQEYHAMLDPFQRWLDGCVVRDPGPGAKVSANDLFRSWDTFRSCESRFGASPANSSVLVKKMVEKGFVFGSTGGYKQLWGYKIAQSDAGKVF